MNSNVVLFAIAVAAAFAVTDAKQCKDEYADCPKWATTGDCDTGDEGSMWMHDYCEKSCGVCACKGDYDCPEKHVCSANGYCKGGTTEIRCKPLSQQKGRCGPSWGGRCNKNLANYAVYCNEKNGWCGVTNAHKNAQKGDTYDWKPASCQAKTCKTIKIRTEKWGNENSYAIGSCESKRTYGNKENYEENCCLTPGSYSLECKDSYRDGWHGGYLEIDGTKYCEDFKSGHLKTVAGVTF